MTTLENARPRRMSEISMESGFQSLLISMDYPISSVKTMKIYEWLLKPQLYFVGYLYMTARLYINISQTYITFYVQYALLLSQDMVSNIPMTIFISGFAISMVLNFVTDKFGYKSTFMGSCIVGIGNFFLKYLHQAYFLWYQY